MQGAGGTSGGIGQFLIGFIMMCTGIYLFLDSVHINSHFGLRNAFMSLGGFNLTGGMVLIPFIFGIGIVFYNSRNPIGWLLTIGSLSAFAFGVISSVQFVLRGLSAFELIMMFVLGAGGLGLFLNSLRSFEDEKKTDKNV